MRRPQPAVRSTPLPRLERVALAVTASALGLASCGPAIDANEPAMGGGWYAQSSGSEPVRVEVRVHTPPPPPSTVIVAQPAVVPMEPPQVVYVRPPEPPSEPVYYVPPQPVTPRPVHIYVPPSQPPETRVVPVIPAPVYPQQDSSLHIRGGARRVGPGLLEAPTS